MCIFQTVPVVLITMTDISHKCLLTQCEITNTNNLSESVLIFIQGEDSQVFTLKSIFRAEMCTSFTDAEFLPTASIRVPGGTEIQNKHL